MQGKGAAGAGARGAAISLNRLLPALPPLPDPRTREGCLAPVPKRSPRPGPERGSPLAPDTRTQAAPNIPSPPRSGSSFHSPNTPSKGSGSSKSSPSPSELLQSSRGRGAHPGPPKPTEASSPGPSLLNNPRALALPNGDGSAKRDFLSTRAPPDPPNLSESRPLPPLSPFFGQLLLPPSPTSSLPNSRQNQPSGSLSPPRVPGPPSPSLGSPGRAPELRAAASTPHPPRAPARAGSPQRPALTGEAHDIMEHGTGDFQEQNPPTRFQ